MKRKIASLFGIGHSPVAPGTAASLVASFAALVVHWAGGPLPLLCLAFATVLAGFWALNGLRETEEADPPWVVIDEAAGQFIALLPASAFLELQTESQALPLIALWATGFLMFRLFDIWKPWIIGRADKIEGQLGIMLDDMLAGVAAGAAVAFAAAILETSS